MVIAIILIIIVSAYCSYQLNGYESPADAFNIVWMTLLIGSVLATLILPIVNY